METSFLLQPSEKTKEQREAEAKRKAKKESVDNSGKKARILRSSDESSEEDFYFLEKALKESNELDDVDRRLLAGIV